MHVVTVRIRKHFGTFFSPGGDRSERIVQMGAVALIQGEINFSSICRGSPKKIVITVSKMLRRVKKNYVNLKRGNVLFIA